MLVFSDKKMYNINMNGLPLEPWQSEPKPVTPQDLRQAQIGFIMHDNGDGVHANDFNAFLADVGGHRTPHVHRIVDHLIDNGQLLRDDSHNLTRPEGWELDPPLNRRERIKVDTFKFLGRVTTRKK